jgi:hypothetical protein
VRVGKFNADGKFGDGLSRRQIDSRQQRVVLVGDERELAVGTQPYLFGIGAGGQIADAIQGFGVDDGDGVVVAEADIEQLLILRQRDPARALADLDRLDRRESVEIDDGDRIALLVGDIGGVGERRRHGAQRGE